MAITDDNLLPWPRTADDGVTPLGLDVTRLQGDIQRIVRSRVTPPRGMTIADFFQEVLLLIVRRNRMPSAYDPRRGSWTNYVVRIAQTCRSHYLEQVLLPDRVPPAPSVIAEVLYSPSAITDDESELAKTIYARKDLSLREKDILVLRLDARMSWHEIAEHLLEDAGEEVTPHKLAGEVWRISTAFYAVAGRIAGPSTVAGIMGHGAEEGELHPVQSSGNRTNARGVGKRPLDTRGAGTSLACKPKDSIRLHGETRKQSASPDSRVDRKSTRRRPHSAHAIPA